MLTDHQYLIQERLGEDDSYQKIVGKIPTIYFIKKSRNSSLN